MKRKTLSSILVIGLICTSLTGCVSFSYENPVKADTYVAELPDGETVVLDQEEAEAILQAQEELGITQKDIEKVHDEFSNEETVEEVEEETIEKQKPFNLSEELGSKVGTTKALGIKYEIYKNGAVIEEVEESFATIPEEIEYEGTNYPVTGLGDIHEEWTDFAIPTHIKYIMERAFGGSNLTRLDIPDTVIYMSGSSTFSGSSIEEITLPSNLRTDSEWSGTFHECSNLKSITIPNDVTSMRGTFTGCTNLTNIQLSSSLETLYGSTFENCTNLTELSLPNSLTSIIGEGVFSRCGIKNIILPDSLIVVDLIAFNQSNLEELIIPDSVTDYDSLGNIMYFPNLKVLKYSNSMEYKLSAYENYSSPNWAENLEITIIFPDTLTDLDERYFERILAGNITIQVPENTVEYFKNKFPEINVVAKE